jgi:hypothetical protein
MFKSVLNIKEWKEENLQKKEFAAISVLLPP